MPRLIDPVLLQALDRANPNVCHFVEVNAPDVGQVLRRAVDQFLKSPPKVSETPANSISADPAGSLTLASATTPLVEFPYDDDETVNLPRTALGGDSFRAFTWLVDPAFGRAVLSTFTAHILRDDRTSTQDLALQIYRRSSASGQTTWVPILSNAVVWKSTPAAWAVLDSVNQLSVDAVFDLTDLHLEIGHSNVAPILSEPVGEEQAYYFVIEPVNGTSDGQFAWVRDRSSTRAVAGVGTFVDRRWKRFSGTTDFAWVLDTTIPDGVPTASIALQAYVATAQVVYVATMATVPQAASVGRIVFERALPAGTAAVLELSTAGSGGPWTAVTDGDLVTARQLTYHLRITLTPDAHQRVAPRVAAMGVQWVTPVDVTAEAIVDPISAEIAVPFCDAAIGEGRVSVLRTGRRDYRDLGSDLAATHPTSKLEANVFLGSRHPSVSRDKWLRIDRAFVNNREPTATAEQFGLLSYLKTLKRKIPVLSESVNDIRTVTSASTNSVTVTPNLPVPSSGSYADRGYYMRVRSSDQPKIGTGYIQTIDSATGTNTLNFVKALPGTLAAGDVIEIHSAEYGQNGLSWSDADPADVWFEILNVHCGVPLERIGAANLGRAGLSGYPPTVLERAPGDADTQAKLRVTFATTDQESADKLINQLSFIMGGATVEIGGQIVFRQIYPLRDPTGKVVVAAEPIAATFDVRNMTGLSTPSAVEQRMAQLSCTFGVDTTAVAKDTAAAVTTNFVDVDALAWLDDQPVDELAPAAISSDIARWCFNSSDQGDYLASMLTQQVVRATSTGLRVWPWTATEAQPQLVIGDRVVVITDQYTDYDPSRKLAIRGWFAYTLVVVSVNAGGTQFRGFMLGLTDAVQLKGGPGTLPVVSTEKVEILSVTFNDSADGTERTYTIVCDDAVDTVHVHHRTWPVGTAGDPFDFSALEDTVADPQLIIVRRDPADGLFRFTIKHPARGTQTPILMVPRQGPPSLAIGSNTWKDILDPAPPADSAKIHPHVTGATVDLEIDVRAGVSDWPVTADVFEGASDSAPILSVVLTASRVLDHTTNAELSGRALPAGKDSLTWRVRLTNVAGEEFWFGPASANRDPLPNGTVTVGNYRANAVLVIAFDPDTDAIKVTLPDGRTKSWNRAQLDAAGSPVQYIVGSTLLDDASTETALGVDEARTNYKVEYQGGGTWVTMWGPSTLHGQPSNPPTALVTTTINANRTAESVEITPDTQVEEQLHVYYREGDSDTAPMYVACVSAGDRTPKAFNAGHVVGAADYFANIDGSGSPTTVLAAIALTRDQIKRHAVMIEGADSGLESPWIPVVLSLMEQPWLESFSAEWDQATGSVLLRAKGGAHTASVLFELSASPTFSSPITDSSALADGGDVARSEALSGAQRGKTWYAGATPYNAAALGGIPGVRQVVQVAVSAIVGDPQITVVESAGNATITIVIDDPGSVLNFAWSNGTITTALHFEINRLGVRTIEAPTTHAAAGTTHTWTKVVALDELHMILALLYLHFLDGSASLIADIGIDADKISDVVNASVANVMAMATVTVNWDSDTATGSGGARYSLDNGANWIALAVSAGTLLSQFNVTRTSVKQTALIQGKNAVDGAWGNQNTVEIDSYEASGSSGALQGTVSIDANGVYGFSADLAGAASFRWSMSPSGYVADTSTASFGTLVSMGGLTTATVNNAGTLSFGQTAFITIVPFSGTGGTGTQLQAIHIRGSYLTMTATKTLTFSAAGIQCTTNSPTAGAFSIDSSGFLSVPSMDPAAVLDFRQFLPGIPSGTSGVTLSSAVFELFSNSTGAALSVSLWRNSGTSSTMLGSASAGNSGSQAVSVGLSENTANRGYHIRVQFFGSSLSTSTYNALYLTYSMPDPKQTA